MFKLSNPDVKMDFLGFTCRIVMHCLKLATLKKQIQTNIIYPGKRSWKDNAAVAVNERTQGQHYSEKCLQKGAGFALRNQEHDAPFAKLVCVSSHVLSLLIWTNEISLSSLYEF